MQKTKVIVLASALAFTATGVSAKSMTTVEKQSFSGKQGATTFFVSQSVKCGKGKKAKTGTVVASGFLSGSEQITKQTGTPTTVNNGVFVEVDQYSNSCTGTSLGFAIGGIANGFTPPNQRLNSAGLDGTATVQDFDSGAQLAVTLDIVIEGTGPVTASKSTTKTKTPPPVVITITSSASANRSGIASGTITIENFELDPEFSSTTLSDNMNSEITIQK